MFSFHLPLSLDADLRDAWDVARRRFCISPYVLCQQFPSSHSRLIRHKPAPFAISLIWQLPIHHHHYPAFSITRIASIAFAKTHVGADAIQLAQPNSQSINISLVATAPCLVSRGLIDFQPPPSLNILAGSTFVFPSITHRRLRQTRVARAVSTARVSVVIRFSTTTPTGTYESTLRPLTSHLHCIVFACAVSFLHSVLLSSSLESFVGSLQRDYSILAQCAIVFQSLSLAVLGCWHRCLDPKDCFSSLQM